MHLFPIIPLIFFYIDLCYVTSKKSMELIVLCMFVAIIKGMNEKKRKELKSNFFHLFVSTSFFFLFLSYIHYTCSFTKKLLFSSNINWSIITHIFSYTDFDEKKNNNHHVPLSITMCCKTIHKLIAFILFFYIFLFLFLFIKTRPK